MIFFLLLLFQTGIFFIYVLFEHLLKSVILSFFFFFFFNVIKTKTTATTNNNIINFFSPFNNNLELSSKNEQESFRSYIYDSDIENNGELISQQNTDSCLFQSPNRK